MREPKKPDCYAWHRANYAIPVKAGMDATYQGKTGKIVRKADPGPHVWFRITGETHARPYHPTDLAYGAETTEGVPK